jgi:hypothetical protein
LNEKNKINEIQKEINQNEIIDFQKNTFQSEIDWNNINVEIEKSFNDSLKYNDNTYLDEFSKKMENDHLKLVHLAALLSKSIDIMNNLKNNSNLKN